MTKYFPSFYEVQSLFVMLVVWSGSHTTTTIICILTCVPFQSVVSVIVLLQEVSYNSLNVNASSEPPISSLSLCASTWACFVETSVALVLWVLGDRCSHDVICSGIFLCIQVICQCVPYSLPPFLACWAPGGIPKGSASPATVNGFYH